MTERNHLAKAGGHSRGARTWGRKGEVSNLLFKAIVRSTSPLSISFEVSPDNQVWYRWGSNATPTGETVYCAPLATTKSEFVDWLLSQPLYEKSWYEVKGGAFGDEWVKVKDILTNERPTQSPG